MDNTILISLDVLLLLLVFLFIFYIRIPKILPILHKRLCLCRNFVIEHEAPFNIGFILLFALEQGLLVIYIFLFREQIDHLKVIVSLFSLIVIATASLQAILLQTRLKYEKERSTFAKKLASFLKRAGKKLKKK